MAAFLPSATLFAAKYGSTRTSTPFSQNLCSHSSPRRAPSACEKEQVQSTSAVRFPRVAIDYCTGCRWGLRAGWMAQELLVTFEKELGEVALRPGSKAGVFDVWVNEEQVWSREEMRRFPEMKELKQLVRDVVVPTRALGHSDK